MIPVLWAIRDQRPGRAFLIGWLAGIVMNIGGFYWAIQMFQEFAGMAWPLAALGLLLLAAANGILVAAWAWATRLITRDTGWNVAWVSPVVWTALEKFWPEMFPNYLGASQYKLPLVTQVADLTGILGVTFIVVYINSTLFAVLEQWFQNRRSRHSSTAGPCGGHGSGADLRPGPHPRRGPSGRGCRTSDHRADSDQPRRGRQAP